MKLSSRNLFGLLRIFFGVVFVLSSVLKFIDINSFSNALTKFHLLSESLVPFFTYSIPSIELLLGLLLVLNLKTDTVAQLTIFLVALFTAVVISKVFEGEQISCGCFGNLTESKIDSTTISEIFYY